MIKLNLIIKSGGKNQINPGTSMTADAEHTHRIAHSGSDYSSTYRV